MLRRRTLVASILLLILAACNGADGVGSQADGSLQVGDRAPRFSLPAASGSEVSLDEFIGRKPVLLYFSMGPG